MAHPQVLKPDLECRPLAFSLTIATVRPGRIIGSLSHEQVILYGLDPFDAPCDVTGFIDGILRTHEAAQLDRALVSLDTDLE